MITVMFRLTLVDYARAYARLTARLNAVLPGVPRIGDHVLATAHWSEPVNDVVWDLSAGVVRVYLGRGPYIEYNGNEEDMSADLRKAGWTVD